MWLYPQLFGADRINLLSGIFDQKWPLKYLPKISTPNSEGYLCLLLGYVFRNIFQHGRRQQGGGAWPGFSNPGFSNMVQIQ